MSKLASGTYGVSMKFDTTAFKKFAADLKKLDLKDRKNYMQQACRHAAVPVRDAMKMYAPKGDRGKLKNSIETTDLAATGLGSFYGVRVGPIIRGRSKKKVNIAHLVELGTTKKVKRPRKGKNRFVFDSRKNPGQKVVTPRIFHGRKADSYVAKAKRGKESVVKARLEDKMKTLLKTKIAKAIKKKYS